MLNPLFKDEDDSTILSFINIIWTLVQEEFSAEWETSILTKHKDSNLLKKSTIVALTEYIVLQSKAAQRYAGFSFTEFDKNSIKTKVLDHNVFKLPPEFFNLAWKGGLDTSGGKELIKESIEQIVNNIDNDIDWHIDVNLFKTK